MANMNACSEWNGSPGNSQILQRLQELSFSNMSMSHGQLKAIVSHCVSLHSLHFSSCSGISDKDLCALLERLRGQLRRFSLRGSSRTPKLTDLGGRRIGILTNLQELDLTDCLQIGEKTVQALGSLVHLCVFKISRVRVHSESLLISLASMKVLRTLDISHTSDLSPLIFKGIPSSLHELNVAGSSALCDDTPEDYLSHLISLKVLTLQISSERPGLSSLAPFESIAASFVYLDMSQSTLSGDWSCGLLGKMNNLRVLKVDNCNIPGGWPLSVAKSLPNVEMLTLSGSRGMRMELTSLASMKSLRHLKLCGCRNVGNRTAVAVSSLPRLETLAMTNTMIDEDGAKALAEGVCKYSLRSLRLHKVPGLEYGRQRMNDALCSYRQQRHRMERNRSWTFPHPSTGRESLRAFELV